MAGPSPKDAKGSRTASLSPAHTLAPAGTWTRWSPSDRSSGSSQICMGCEGEGPGKRCLREGVWALSALPVCAYRLLGCRLCPGPGGRRRGTGPCQTPQCLHPSHGPCLEQDLQGGAEGQRPGRFSGERRREATGEWGQEIGFWGRDCGRTPSMGLGRSRRSGPPGPALPRGPLVPSGALHRDLPGPRPLPPPVPAHSQAGGSGAGSRASSDGPSGWGRLPPGTGSSPHGHAGPVAESPGRQPLPAQLRGAPALAAAAGVP